MAVWMLACMGELPRKGVSEPYDPKLWPRYNRSSVRRGRASVVVALSCVKFV